MGLNPVLNVGLTLSLDCSQLLPFPLGLGHDPRGNRAVKYLIKMRLPEHEHRGKPAAVAVSILIVWTVARMKCTGTGCKLHCPELSHSLFTRCKSL